MITPSLFIIATVLIGVGSLAFSSWGCRNVPTSKAGKEALVLSIMVGCFATTFGVLDYCAQSLRDANDDRWKMLFWGMNYILVPSFCVAVLLSQPVASRWHSKGARKNEDFAEDAEGNPERS